MYMCTSVIMARAARSHQSEPGRPLLSLLLGGRVRGDAARDADVLLERPRSNCGSCSICSRYVCPGVYQRQQVGPDYLTARSPSTALRLRVCPCERVFHARVCALTAHPLYSRSASKTAPRWQGLPLRARVPRSGVCTSNHTHLYSRSTSKTVPRWQGLPLRARVPRSGVCTSPHTFLYSRSASKTATRTFTFVACPKTAPRWQGLPLRACVPRSGVCTSNHTHLYSRNMLKTAPR